MILDIKTSLFIHYKRLSVIFVRRYEELLILCILNNK